MRNSANENNFLAYSFGCLFILLDGYTAPFSVNSIQVNILVDNLRTFSWWTKCLYFIQYQICIHTQQNWIEDAFHSTCLSYKMRFIAHFARLISLTQIIFIGLTNEFFFYFRSMNVHVYYLHVYKITTVSLTFWVILFSLTQQYHDVYTWWFTKWISAG